MRFTKMHGCGNDFIVTHEVSAAGAAILQKDAQALCDRRIGVGADGIVLVMQSGAADLRMRIFNADGSEAEMCGNGIRCAFAYALSHGLAQKPRIVFETIAGAIETVQQGDRVRVNMGSPRLKPALIPVNVSGDRVIDHDLIAGGKSFRFTGVSMGNPHAVIHVDEIDDEMVLGYGPKIECHSMFPRRVNVEFATVVSPQRVRMRVFERGVGETMACGTGACATAVAGVLTGRHENAVTVELRGGELDIEWNGRDSQPVFMTGPAVRVFDGQVDKNYE